MGSFLKRFGGFSQQIPLLPIPQLLLIKKTETYMPLSKKFYSTNIKDKVKKMLASVIFYREKHLIL